MTNRRDAARLALEEPFDMLLVEPKQTNISIVVDEISYRGLRFSSPNELNIDQELIFKIPALNMQEHMIGKIVWKKQENLNQYSYGVKINRHKL